MSKQHKIDIHKQFTCKFASIGMCYVHVQYMCQ